MGQHRGSSAPLTPQRAFVVQFRTDADVAAGRMAGGGKRRNRIETRHESISGQPSHTLPTDGRSAVRRSDAQRGGREMTPEQIALVQESFQQVDAIADQAAELFYHTLFALDPQLKRLFRSDMQTQGRKLMQMMGLAVHGLKSPDTLIPAVQALGKQHVAYGVEENDDETVGKALLLTVEQELGADFTPQVKGAWRAT